MLRNTSFSFASRDASTLDSDADFVSRRYQGKHSEYLDVRCPFGNRFRVHPYSDTVPLRGQLGIGYLQLFCSVGTASAIGSFYERVFSATVSSHLPAEATTKSAHLPSALVEVGMHQLLVFTEAKEELVCRHNAFHICVYVHNFSASFRNADAHCSLFVNPRFADHCLTLPDALVQRQFRLRDIVPLPDSQTKSSAATGANGTSTAARSVLYQLEHEVRSMYHPFYLRTLVNRSGNTGIYCAQ